MKYRDKQLLNTACKLGRGLLENGGEIYRVEESINFFLTAYGVKDPQIFAIPATIIVTIPSEGVPLTQIERVVSISQNMNRMHKINDLCRTACREKPDPDRVLAQLDRINSLSPYPFWRMAAAYGVASGFFALFWGGNLRDALIAFIAGIATKFCLSYMDRFNSNIFFSNLVSSMVIAVFALVGVNIGIGCNLDKIIIGAIMTLVPGVAITNIMRDIISGDIITGTTKIAEVLLVATSIAIGIALSLSAAGAILGGVI